MCAPLHTNRSDLPPLLPAPRHLEPRERTHRLTTRIAVPDGHAWLHERFVPARLAGNDPRAHIRHDAAIRPGGYELRVGSSSGSTPNIRIDTSDFEGERNALATLAQLIGSGTLQELEIRDEPALPVRGVMLDVSRDRVPRMDELFTVIDRLAALKINHLQLYVEHTFLYAGHESVSEGLSPMTPDELRRIDERCAERGITLAANQNCFGHLSGWLLHPRYAPLAETHGEWDFAGITRSGPFSLCPLDPASLDLVRDLIRQQAPCVRSGLFNIGCDETYDIGRGRSRDAVASQGKGKVYGRFVRLVCDAAMEAGARPMFWSDIATEHPEALDMLPDRAIALVWGYEPSSPFGAWCDLVRGRGHEAWVTPGTSAWRSIVGRTRERRANMERAGAEGIRAGATGMLIADWGDLGHRQQWPITLHALADGADAAWNAGRSPRAHPEAIGLHAFGDPTGRIGPWLETLGDVDAEIRAVAGVPDGEGRDTPLPNASALFTSLHPARPGYRLPARPDPWLEVLDRIEHLRACLPTGAGSLVTEELEHTLDVAWFAAARAAGRLGGIPTPDAGERLESIIRAHRRLWLARSRPGGLDHSASFYAQLKSPEADPR